MQTRNTHDTESFAHGTTRTYMDDNQIVAIRTQGDMSRDAVNTWASLLILTMQEWKSEHPIGLLLDLTHPNQGLTPYTRERALDLMNRIPDGMTVHCAVILPGTFMYRIIEMFLRTPAFHRSGHKIEVFRSEKQALNWLREELAND